MTIYNFYDTSSLLLLADQLFEEQPQNTMTLISSVTLKELENIKTNPNKSINVKHAARILLDKLDKYQDKYLSIIYLASMEDHIKQLELNNDAKIIACAFDFYKDVIIPDKNRVRMFPVAPDVDFKFYTNDVSMRQLAGLFFPKETVVYVKGVQDTYKGYTNAYLSDEQMAAFYECDYKVPAEINEYVNIYNMDYELVDTVCYTGEEYRPLKYKTFESDQLGNIKPVKGDIYQAMAADSLLNNQITMLRGPAGAGKSHLALGYLFYLLEHNRIDRIIIFCNTVATKNAAKLGYYPGDKNEKLMDAQIGNMLSSKLGGQEAVLRLIEENKLILLPMSDIRGYDTSGMNAGIYITEAQNLDVTLAKLALQRVGDDCIMILDGDTESQVDLVEYDGVNNGLRRVSKVFRGHDFYGEVTLKLIHRGKIAELANEL